MSLYDSDREEIEKMIESRMTEAPEGTKQILICCIGIILIFTMFFGTICYTSVQKTKRIQIEKFGEEIVRMEDK